MGYKIALRTTFAEQTFWFEHWKTLKWPQNGLKMAAKGPKMAETFWNSRILKKHTFLPPYQKIGSNGAKMAKWERKRFGQTQKQPPLLAELGIYLLYFFTFLPRMQTTKENVDNPKVNLTKRWGWAQKRVSVVGSGVVCKAIFVSNPIQPN